MDEEKREKIMSSTSECYSGSYIYGTGGAGSLYHTKIEGGSSHGNFKLKVEDTIECSLDCDNKYFSMFIPRISKTIFADNISYSNILPFIGIYYKESVVSII